MIKQKQLNLHDPDNGMYGDCLRTCFACLLDKKPEEVPNFGVYYGKIVPWNKAVDEYLATQELVRVEIAFGDENGVEGVLLSRGNLSQNAYYLLAGMSRSGVNHSVIALGDKIIWDPAQNDSGIIGPCDDGYYWVTYLVPLKFSNVRAN